jgi:REP element-mobilizing transposase RayT
MARPLRIQFPGAVYHVTNRGNEQKAIFKNDADRRKFLEILSESAATYSARIYSFVLMANHVHLLVETPLGNLSEFMRHFNITYTSYFNRHHRRVGHLYQGRYKSILVDRDEYLSMASSYIHLNPVKVIAARRLPAKEQLDRLWNYKWSSLPGFISARNRFDFVEYGVILADYGGDIPAGRSRYKNQIARDLVEGLPLREKVVGQSLLGGENFVNTITEKFLTVQKEREQPAVGAIRQFVARDEILRVLVEASGRNVETILTEAGPLRQMAMDLLYRHGGMNNPEIGKLMGIDYSTVSQGRKRLRPRIAKEKKLQDILTAVESRLSRIKI